MAFVLPSVIIAAVLFTCPNSMLNTCSNVLTSATELVCLTVCQLRIYRDLACVRFRRWIYRVPRGHMTNGVPACALDRIRQTFAAESSCSFSYPR